MDPILQEEHMINVGSPEYIMEQVKICSANKNTGAQTILVKIKPLHTKSTNLECLQEFIEEAVKFR